MTGRRKLLAGVAAAIVVMGVGTGVVLASAGDDDKPLTGTDLERATEAALDHVGEGRVVETEVGDDGAAYGVEVRKDDGSVVEVNLDPDFAVIGTEADDDSPGEEDDPTDD